MSHSEGSSPAAAEIRRRILEQGRIPFHEFMELALYHPEGGYYTRLARGTGRRGDFSTSSDVSPAFGRRIAVQVAEVHRRLGGGPWRLIELGPGRGLLALDLLEGLRRFAPESLARLDELLLAEISPALRELQRRRLEPVAGSVNLRWVERLDEIEPGEGVAVGNEFLDALPVHLVERRREGLREMAVCLRGAGVGDRAEEGGSPAGGGLTLCDGGPAGSELEAHAERYGLCARVGDRAEVCLEMPVVLRDLSRVLRRGAAILIDYGLPAERLGDEAHREGTLVAYHRHRVVEDLLARPGEQDLTAHVNWSHLEDAAAATGFEPAGRIYQDRFLMNLGLLEDLAAPPEGDEDPSAATERLAARALIMPGAGGGKRFEAVGLVKGIEGDLMGWKGLRASWPAQPRFERS